MEENFTALRKTYMDILVFNENTGGYFFSPWEQYPIPNMKFGNPTVKIASSLVCLSLPIVCDVKSTFVCFFYDFSSKFHKADGMLISSKISWNCQICTQMYYSIVMPHTHVLTLSPFWSQLFDKKNTLHSCFYYFLKLELYLNSLER